MNISLPPPLNEYIQCFKPNLLNISQFVLHVGVPSYPVPLSQFRHKLRKEFRVTVNVSLGKGNRNVSLSAEGTATHEAVVTVADCPNSGIREVDLSFQFCSTGKRKYQRRCRNVINGFINDREENAQLDYYYSKLKSQA
jgi:hypothetical protein